MLLIDRESDELDCITLTNQNGTYLIRRDTTKGLLTIDSLADLPLNNKFLEYVWFGSLSVGYTLAIETDDLAQYGLDTPVVTVDCKYYDGSRVVIYIGDSVPGNSSAFYYRIDGYNGQVFSASFDLSFFQGDSYWLSDDIFSGDGTGYGTEIGNVNLWGTAFPSTLVITAHDSKDKSDPWHGYNYILTAPASGAADNYNMSVLCDELSSLTAAEALVAYPTEQQITEYGLDRPYAVVKHQRGGVWHILRLAKASYDTLYAKADGVEVIYALNADSYPLLSSLSPEVIRSPDVHVRTFAAIERISFDFDGEHYEFRLERGDLGNDLYSYRLFCGDTEISQTQYQQILEIFNSAAAISYGTADASQSPRLTVVIDYFDSFGRGNETILYTPVGNRRYLCTINGVGDCIVTEMWLDQLIAAVRALPDAAV